MLKLLLHKFIDFNRLEQMLNSIFDGNTGYSSAGRRWGVILRSVTYSAWVCGREWRTNERTCTDAPGLFGGCYARSEGRVRHERMNESRSITGGSNTVCTVWPSHTTSDWNPKGIMEDAHGLEISIGFLEFLDSIRRRYLKRFIPLFFAENKIILMFWTSNNFLKFYIFLKNMIFLRQGKILNFLILQSQFLQHISNML